MSEARRLWKGELPLPQAFWQWAVFGGLIVNLTTSGAFLFLTMNDRPVLALILGYGPSLPFNLLVSVGVWRSATRYLGDPVWASLAQASTIIGMILLSIT